MSKFRTGRLRYIKKLSAIIRELEPKNLRDDFY